MDRILEYVFSLLFPSLGSQPLRYELPECGKNALREAYQQPKVKNCTNCRQGLQYLCADSDLLDRYIWNVGAYCQITRSTVLGVENSDYNRALQMLEDACPQLRNFNVLERRQGNGTVSTAPATASVVPVTSSAPPPTTSVAPSVTTPTTTTPPAVASSSNSAVVSPVPSASQSSLVGGSSSIPASVSSSNTAPGGTSSSTSSGPVNSPAVKPSGVTSTTSSEATSSTSKTPISIPPVVSVAPFIQAGSVSTSVVNPVVSLPTQTYTGQAILTGSCVTAMYTAFQLPDGTYIAAPIVGCDDQNPQCCPSLSQPASATITSSVPYIPIGEANSAILSALSSNPITTCPDDYTSTSSVCCPYGFDLYNTLILSQTPCYSILPTSLAIPDAVSQEIMSLSSRIASTATDPSPTVSVNIITNEVFALSLPLHNGVERSTAQAKKGLPLAAEIGIGVGVGILVLLVIGVVIWVVANRRRRNQGLGGDNGRVNEWAAMQSQRKSLASSGTAQTSTAWSPKPAHLSHSSVGWPPQQQSTPDYYPMPPSRSSLQPMPMAQVGQYKPESQSHGRYSELPGDYSGPVEVDGRQIQSIEYDIQSLPPPPPHDQGYGQGRIYGHPYLDNNQSRRNDWK